MNISSFDCKKEKEINFHKIKPKSKERERSEKSVSHYTPSRSGVSLKGRVEIFRNSVTTLAATDFRRINALAAV